MRPGTTVIENIWSVLRFVCTQILAHLHSSREMSQDEQQFADPDEFRPERFLHQADNHIGKATRDDSQFTFGFGRRYVPLLN